MNCKQGDLAVIVHPIDAGKVVEVMEGGPRGLWFVRGMSLRCHSGVFDECWIPDSSLRPIRDNPGTDETLTWAPRREGVPA